MTYEKARLAAQSRSHLDERFRELGPATRYTPPVRGWIKAVREALGMTTAQLAKRLGDKAALLSSPRTVGGKGHHRAGDLAARGRGTRLHLIYRACAQETAGSDASATARARSRAAAEAPVEHSMLLEDQKVKEKDAEARLDEIVRETNPRLFWD